MKKRHSKPILLFQIIAIDLLSSLFTPVSQAQEKAQASSSVAHVVVIGVDALRRSVLYELLSNNQLPNLGSIFGTMTHSGSISDNGDASFNSGYTMGVNYCTTAFPSFTFASWASNFTGTYVKNHGITGNGWFDRSQARFYGFSASEIASYSDVVGAYEYEISCELTWPPAIECLQPLNNGGLANSVLQTQTIYEAAANAGKTSTIVFNMYSSKNHASNPYITWIKPTAGDLITFANIELGNAEPSEYDISMMDKAVDYINQGNSPNILTVYFAGHDVNSHLNGVVDGENSNQQEYYLKNVIDPQIGRLLSALQNSANWDYANTVFVIIADHGQTDVPLNDTYAIQIETSLDDELEDVFQAVDYDVLDNIYEDPQNTDSVVGLNGGLAHIYVRKNAGTDSWGNWSEYPNYWNDIRPLAEAFRDANADGSYEGELEGAFDLILVRKSNEYNSWQAPYEVYLGDGATQDLNSYLASHPELDYYVDALRRISNYNSQRSGDILLLPKYAGPSNENGQRYYFSSEARGMHGSLNEFDSYIPLIFAQPGGGGSIQGQTIQRAESVDIASTVASLLGFNMNNVDGRNLFESLFTDDPLVGGVHTVKKTHIQELRNYIDNLRQSLGWQGYNWTDPNITQYTTVIKAVHITDLRTAIEQLYDAIGYSLPDLGEVISVGGIIKADHINKLRRAMENIW